jgi:hypothetical protein
MYSETITIDLGTDFANQIADLTIQLWVAGVVSGSPISTGFFNIDADNGVYGWSYSSFADGTTYLAQTLVGGESLEGVAPDRIKPPGPTAAEVAVALGSAANLTIYSPAVGSTLDLYRGDAYQHSEGRAVSIAKAASETHWPTTLTTVHFSCKPTAKTLELYPSAQSLTEIAGTVTQATGSSQALRLEFTALQMAALSAGVGAYDFWIIGNKATYPATLRSGAMTARPDRTW